MRGFAAAAGVDSDRLGVCDESSSVGGCRRIGRGAAAAHAAAAMAPARFSKLITMAVPYPPGVFFESLVTSPEQQRRSWYMFYFQLPMADAAVPLNDFAFWSPGF